MKTRAAVAVAALALAGLTPAAGAAAKKSCNLLPDGKDDVYATAAAPETTTPDGALDAVMGDLGSDSKTITAVIRLAKLARPASTSPGGATYELRFAPTASDKTYTLWANVTGATATFGIGTINDVTAAQLVDSTGTATGVVDVAKSEIRISAPLSAVEGAKPGKKVSLAEIIVKRSAANQFYGRQADDASGGKAYVLGAATCVPVGK